MRLFEWEGKRLLRDAGVAVPPGRYALDAADAKAAARELDGAAMVKAQLLAGGRGKRGGVVPADTPDDAERAAARLLAADFDGVRAAGVLVEARRPLVEEWYAAVTVDDVAGRPSLLVSRDGGTGVDAAVPPARVTVDPLAGLRPFEAARALKTAGVDGQRLRPAADALVRLYRAFAAAGAALVEVNPFGPAEDETILALDAKVTLDADTPPPAWLGPRPLEGTSREQRARALGITYVELDGTVGVISMGAGFTMQILDLIADEGGRPANFADLTGGAQGAAGFRHLVPLIFERARAGEVRALVFAVILSATPLDVVTATVTDALRAFPPPVPIMANVVAAGAATRALSLEACRARLAEVGCMVFDDLRDAVREAVRRAA